MHVQYHLNLWSNAFSNFSMLVFISCTYEGRDGCSGRLALTKKSSWSTPSLGNSNALARYCALASFSPSSRLKNSTLLPLISFLSVPTRKSERELLRLISDGPPPAARESHLAASLG